ncbi:MAG: uracil-DNA glycosylase [Pseudomonadota bacterium]|nr:uracil-DNA glycosylase [Pseudomonadota bacterium]MEC7237337.1 uracil-DNA glycosylase [Pseudomonadota bacterium]
MAANPSQRRRLIDQLAWQEAMGIDEVLLDDAAGGVAGAVAVPLSALTGASGPSDGSAPAPQTSAPMSSTPTTQPPVPTPSAPPPAASAMVASADLAGITSLAALRSALEAFEGCALKHTASNMIFADGNPAARLMVVGEVPGRDEDRVGLPLVGGAGQLFDRMLASIGLSRADAYVTTLIPWRPPGNRTPTSEEMDLLLPWLHRHIQLAKPEFLMLLGGAPAKAMLPQPGGILKLRGRWHDLDLGEGVTCQAMATLHPSYLLRSPAQKRLAYADLLALAGKLG